MRSRFLLGGMAAVADGDRTRLAFLGGVHIPAQQLAAPALRAIGRWTVPRVVATFTEQVRVREP